MSDHNEQILYRRIDTGNPDAAVARMYDRKAGRSTQKRGE
jgi:hypothetical protein